MGAIIRWYGTFRIKANLKGVIFINKKQLIKQFFSSSKASVTIRKGIIIKNYTEVIVGYRSSNNSSNDGYNTYFLKIPNSSNSIKLNLTNFSGAFFGYKNDVSKTTIGNQNPITNTIITLNKQYAYFVICLPIYNGFNQSSTFEFL